MNTIDLKVPAKINLFLKVLGKRDDGYHDIYSWFQAIDLCDRLRITVKNTPGIELIVSGDDNVPADSSNTVFKAASLMKKRFDITNGLKIHLEKSIPSQAGLGGGSSDAAATIYGINRLFDLGLDNQKMSELGLEVGSDVPFFFSSGQAEVSGRGEKIKNIELPLDYYITLAKPSFGLSTSAGYRRLKLDLTSPMRVIKLLHYRNFNAMIDTISGYENDFEEVHLRDYPELAEIKGKLEKAGSQYIRMSGSGPTYFGLFDKLLKRGKSHQVVGADWELSGIRPIALPAWE